jgi:hypothetical protein
MTLWLRHDKGVGNVVWVRHLRAALRSTTIMWLSIPPPHSRNQKPWFIVIVQQLDSRGVTTVTTGCAPRF